MLKKISSFVLIIAMFITIPLNSISAALSSSPIKLDIDKLTPMKNGGQSCGNQAQYGYGVPLAFDSSYIYYATGRNNAYGSFTLKRMEHDGSSTQQLDSQSVAASFNIFGGWIYYGTYNGDNRSIFKVSIDGKNSIKLVSNIVNIGKMIQVEDKIYFTAGVDKGLFCVSTDGGKYKKIIDADIDSYNIEYSHIFYTIVGKNGINIAKLNGEFVGKICEDYETSYYNANNWRIQVHQSLNIENGWLYYISQGHKIFKVKIDGTQQSEVWSTEIRDFCVIKGINVTDQWIYIMVENRNSPIDEYHYNQYICKIRTNGIDYQVLLKNNNLHQNRFMNENELYINDQWIYFGVTDDIYRHADKIYRIKKDGSNLSSLSELSPHSTKIESNDIFIENEIEDFFESEIYNATIIEDTVG